MLDSGDYPALLDKALAHFGWETCWPSARAPARRGRSVGTGMAMFVEEGGRGPTDGANIAVDANGVVEVVTGGASVGQGFETAMAQICAEALGVDYAASASCTARPTASPTASARTPRAPR